MLMLVSLLIVAMFIISCGGQKAQGNSPEEPAVQEEVQAAMEEPAADVEVSQEELDDLKEGIESLEAEDVGGISE